MVKSPKAFCNIPKVSATEISLRKQNLMALLCSTNSDIVKIEKIKSFKLYFSRTVGDTFVAFEQLETHKIEIEAIFNPRPISPMSFDPNDLFPLTLGHSLSGGPLRSFPQMNFTGTPSSWLSNW